MTYGGTVPTITPGYTGFVNGDTAASLTTPPVCSTTATSSSPVGSRYTSSCTGAVDPNYSISYVAGTVTVAKAPLTITASSVAMTYGGHGADRHGGVHRASSTATRAASLTHQADLLDHGHQLEPCVRLALRRLVHWARWIRITPSATSAGR